MTSPRKYRFYNLLKLNDLLQFLMRIHLDTNPVCALGLHINADTTNKCLTGRMDHLGRTWNFYTDSFSLLRFRA